MSRGGKREGAGRPPGSRNERKIEMEAATRRVAAKVEAVLGEVFDGDAHTLLMSIYRDPAQPMPIRLEAAKAAIRFEKPMLAAVELNTTEDVVYRVSAEPLTAEEWEEKHCFPIPKREH